MTTDPDTDPGPDTDTGPDIGAEADTAPAERLAVFRVLIGGFTLAYLVIRFPVFWSLADGRPGRFAPVGVLAFLDEPLSAGLVRGLVLVAVVVAVAVLVGWRFRLTGPALAGSLLVLATYRSSWGQLLHFENLLVLHLMVIGVSPAADVWSVDARRSARRRTPSSPSSTLSPLDRYGFPLRLAAIITAVTYVLAGVAKLRYGGVDWLVGDTLQNHVAYSAARLELLGGTPSPVAGLVVDQGWLFPPLATATVVLELAAPAAVLWPRARTWWVAAAWLMHAGIVALMFIVFPYPLAGVAFAPLFRLERLGFALADRVRKRRITAGVGVLL